MFFPPTNARALVSLFLQALEQALEGMGSDPVLLPVVMPPRTRTSMSLLSATMTNPTFDPSGDGYLQPRAGGSEFPQIGADGYVDDTTQAPNDGYLPPRAIQLRPAVDRDGYVHDSRVPDGRQRLVSSGIRYLKPDDGNARQRLPSSSIQYLQPDAGAGPDEPEGCVRPQRRNVADTCFQDDGPSNNMYLNPMFVPQSLPPGCEDTPSRPLSMGYLEVDGEDDGVDFESAVFTALSRSAAEQLLESEEDGAYLFRTKDSDTIALSARAPTQRTGFWHALIKVDIVNIIIVMLLFDR